MEKLPHAAAVQRLLDEGRIQEAAELHNRHLEAELERARQGEPINLSDLIAAKETLHRNR